tara:strand:- start:33845 stop:34090 length:246 start_codon:yes stop_codon:yes gene_type:complete
MLISIWPIAKTVIVDKYIPVSLIPTNKNIPSFHEAADIFPIFAASAFSENILVRPRPRFATVSWLKTISHFPQSVTDLLPP